MSETADIVIVGGGAGGLAFAWAVADPRLKVVILERGDYVDQRRAPTLDAGWELAQQTRFNANPNIRAGSADHPVDDSGSPIKPAFFNAVGGSTVRWGAHFPRFRPSDFRPRTLDGVGNDWPLDYRELEPWYDLNDRMMGVAGLSGDPGNPPRRRRPCPPLPLCPATEKLAAGFDKLGWHWWPSDAAILTTGRAGRAPCNNCGPCGLGCPRYARASADIAYAGQARAKGVDIRTGATVTGIELSPPGNRVEALSYIDRDGGLNRVACAEAVIAGNGLGTARLLLDQRKIQHTLLGRGLMLHPTAIVTGVFDEPLASYRGAFAAALVSQEFYETDTARGFKRGFQMQVLRGQGPLTTAQGGYGTALPWGKQHAAAFTRSFGRTLSLTVTCDDLPERDNRIEIDANRTDRWGMPIPKMIYRLGKNTKSMLRFGIDRATEALTAAGADKINVTELSRAAGFHLMGTARMAEDERLGVTNRDGRVHGISNLTLADSSLFASAAPVNPTPTLQAIALRAGRAMRDRLGLAGAEPS
ncbi:MAG: GMC family oxidoreductase [Roseibium sp.]|nr:GMC family oxidoreductase [Roseibium sp.]